MKYLFPSNRLIYRFFILSFSIFVFTNYSNAQTYFCDLEDSVWSDIWIGQQTIDSGFAHSGIFLSVTDSVNPYGLGVEMDFPEEKKGINTLVTIEGWVKSSVSFPNALYVVTISDEKNELFWKGIRLDTVITVKDEWFGYSSSFKIPASITKAASFKCYLWNAGGKDTVAIDDLKVDFGEIIIPMSLPEIDELKVHAANNNPEEILYSNQYYSVLYDEVAERIFIKSNNGEKIINNLQSVDHYIVDGEDVTQLTSFTVKGIKSRKGIATLRFVAKSKYSLKKIFISCNDYSPEIEINVEEKYKKELKCRRSTILIESEHEVSEVFRSNRKSDIDNFQREYWLDKQGVLFGEAENSLLIYNTPDISSLQLAANDNLLLINLDYEKDHPFLHFPLDNDSTDYMEDWSASKYDKREKRTNSFNLSIGIKTKSLPRLMKNPTGFLATYIWTEHADFSNIRTNRATYFGSEEISHPKNSTGGFIKYNIPVTKSVFYDNPDGITNAEISEGNFTELESAIQTDTSFHTFLMQIKDRDIEICLHTPEQFTTTPGQLEKALNFTKENFSSVSWIDHGYNNHIENNREDLMCDGLLKRSPYFAAGLWEKYGVRYFWNAYYEDYFTFQDWKFGSSIEPFYSGFGDFMPKPDYWKHPTRSGEIIHWPTSTVLYIEHEGLWEYFYNEQKLKEFVENWAVEMNHCYPAWVDPKKGFWTYNADSIIVAQAGFNKTLERMAVLRDNQQLNVTTVKEFIDYQLLLENIDFQLMPDGRIKIINNNQQDITGLSFATKAKAVLVDRLKPAQKATGDDIIFWFNLEAGASKIIRVIN